MSSRAPPSATVDESEREADRELDALVTDIEPAFQAALVNRAQVQPFLGELKRRVESAAQPNRLAFQAAGYTTTLLIARLKEEDFETSEQIFTNYVDNLVGVTGLSPKSLDVAVNALVMPQRDRIFPLIEEHILGEHFELATIEHSLLLFNLACFYALRSDKPRMLEAIELALQQGKPREQFLNDADFEAYWDDPDFLAVLDQRSP